MKCKNTISIIGSAALVAIFLLPYTSLSGCTKLHTGIDSLSYATGFVIADKYMNSDYGNFWFTKEALPDITTCNFDTIASSLRSGFDGRPRMANRSANLKIHDFFDEQREGRAVNLDSLAVVFGVLFHWEKYRKELVQFEPNVDLLLRGMHDGIFSASNPLLDLQTATNLFNDYYNVRLPELNRARTEKYMAEIEATTPGIRRTESGLLYRIDNPGSSERVTKDDDVCQASYTQTVQLGGIASGMSSWQYQVWRPLNSCKPSFQEALSLIGTGGKITIWTDTSELKEDIFFNRTNPNMPIVYELKLISINQHNH